MAFGQKNPPASRAPSGRTLVIAFFAVAVAFVASTAAAEYGEIEIGRAAAQITANAAPSIQHLAAMRGDLRRFTLLADDEVDRGIEHLAGPAAPELISARRGIDRAWAAYLALPTFPNERGQQIVAEAAKAEMEAAVVRLDAEMDRADWADARNTLERLVKPTADDLDAAAVQLIDLNANAGAKLARHIEDLGKRSVALAFTLDGVSVFLTILAALLIRRVVHRYTSWSSGAPTSSSYSPGASPTTCWGRWAPPRSRSRRPSATCPRTAGRGG
jgi:hypothetical protein